MGEQRLTRRRVLELAGLTAAAAAGGVLPPAGAAKPGGGGAATAPHLYRLNVPPVYLGGGLTAAPGTVDVGGLSTTALTYNGLMPGPTIVARDGDTVTVPVNNGLDEHTTVHWHGLVVPTASDGQPHEAFMPGDRRDYVLPIRQRAGMHWYHPHPHLHTATQVVFGLAGAFLVRDSEEDGLGLPSGRYEVPLVIRDANLDSSGVFTYNGKASGFSGSVFLVNGTRSPYLEVDRAVYRFRILVGSNSRLFRLALSNGADVTLIGNDGGLLPAPVALTEILLSPAERVDVLVDLTGIGSAPVFLRDLSSGKNLVELRPAGVTGPAYSPPTLLSTVAALPRPTAPSRRFSFDGMTKINGKVFSMTRTDFTVPRGQVEDWVLTTSGNAPHPVHIHGVMFQVLSRTGGRGRLFPWEAGWKDTVLLADNETVTVRLRFDLAGRYLMHCHKLEHEDAGMMTAFEVV